MFAHRAFTPVRSNIQCSMALSSNLYCAEDAEDFASWGFDDAGGEVYVEEWAPTLFPITGESFRSLLAAEDGFMPRSEYISGYLSCLFDLTARQDAINWILKVSEFYRFRPVTVYLSVNYLDRFLSVNSPPGKNGKRQCAGDWPMQLLSVACLSVAAKMEETNVPLLLDLQILKPKFVFEPRTVYRMELLLMSALRWRMRAVTPFDFISYFAAAIIFADGRSTSVLSSSFCRSADLILSTHRIIDFLGFQPSVIAAAAVLCAASQVADSAATYHSSIFDRWVNKEMVSKCCQLMEEYLIDTCPIARRNTAPLPTVEPLSPVGILEAAACGSCDSLRSVAADEPNADAGGSDSPPAKRCRLADNLCTVIINSKSYG